MRGVICGADRQSESLLEWWWSRYSLHNDFPVTFYDFGMSDTARRWCKERGDVIFLRPPHIAGRDGVDEKIRGVWEKNYGKEVWQARSAWFCKPLACRSSPYEKTIWLDLDCEVLFSLDPLFTLPGVSLVREFETDHLPGFHPEVMYNSGVIVFAKREPLIERWAEVSLQESHRFSGDQQVLSFIISQDRYEIRELSPEWNWRLAQGCRFDAKIYHWTGVGGKQFIAGSGGILPFLKALY